MSLICPTVLASNINDFSEQLERISFADRIQIDVMDGIFTDSKSIEISDIPTVFNKLIDLHVMYQKPASHFDDFVRLNPNMVIIHAESDCDIPELASRLRQHNINTGVAVLQETKIGDISYLFPHIQHLLIFAGNLGHYGGQADLSLIDKIAEAKQLTTFLEYGWDGGANMENIVPLQGGGVDVINVGGAIQKSNNPQTVFDEMTNLLSQSLS